MLPWVRTPPLILLLACVVDPVGDTPPPVDCTISAYADEDGDGFGTDYVGFACAPVAGIAFVSGDCDDANGLVYPGAHERCDGLDNDCDGVVDDGHEILTWYPDVDDDGYGVTALGVDRCEAPDGDHVLDGGDCNDADRAINPVAREVCNDGVDDDCDGLVDADDDSLDVSTALDAFVDVDGDGFGDPAAPGIVCALADGWSDNGLDCDDADELVHPDVALDACDEIDNDCDGLVDDEDDNVDVSEQILLSCDADGDGLGDAVATCLVCRSTPGIAVDDNQDCDDADALATVTQDWYADWDEDGVGVLPAILVQCLNPNAGRILYPPFAPEVAGIDCDDDAPAIHPGAYDPVGDGVDQDCDTIDG